MTPDIKIGDRRDGHPPAPLTSDDIRFCEQGLEMMCRFYGRARSHFEEMLQNGYSEIRFGRGPLGYSDEVSAEYIISFAAFVKEGTDEITTFEVRKSHETFGDVTQGLSQRKYSPEELQDTIKKFRLYLATEDLESFIKGFSWPQE
jgi:hypothetical protein